MRIKSVTLTWFRGAADSVVLDAACKSMIVYGSNGAGKSSFVDAIEYVVRDGKIAHLTHENSGRNQEKAVPNTHIPSDANTAFGIKFQNDNELSIKIARNGTYTMSGAEAINMSGWDYPRTVLRQDEVAKFISYTKGQKYSALLPLLGLHELEIAADNLRKLGKTVDTESQLTKKQGQLEVANTKRTKSFGNDTDAQIEEKIEVRHKTYCPKSNVEDVLARCKELEKALTLRIDALSEENARHLVWRTIADTNLEDDIKAVKDTNAELASSIEPLIIEKLEVLQAAHSYAGKLKEGEHISCPACGFSVQGSQFKQHIKAEQERLQEIINIFDRRKTAITALIDTLKLIQNNLAKADIKEWCENLKEGDLKENIEWVQQFVPESIRQASSNEVLQDSEKNLLPIIKAANEVSKDAPPVIKALSDDKALVEAAKAVLEAKILANDIASIEKLISFLNALETGVREEIRERSTAIIKDISGDIQAMWKILHPKQPIKDIHLYLPEDDKAIDIALTFHDKVQDSPRLTLSEGYRNALGLCIFLAMANRDVDKDRPLFLDDVVVSLDRNHRGMIVELLKKQFSDRQIVIFTHDRDWYTELRQQLDDSKWLFKTILPYESPTVGIRWSHKTTTFDDARAQLKDRPDTAGNDARKIMDVELSLIAEKLQIRFPYLRGDKNDKRMCNDFLERIIADGRARFQKKENGSYANNTDAINMLEEAKRLLVSWGNKSSHSFDVVQPEATKLIDACESAMGSFKCPSCNRFVWLANVGTSESVQCQCSELRWRYGKG